MIEWLSYWLQQDNTKLIYMLVLILTANLFDFMIGWINAKMNPKIKFSSSKAIYGIARKMIMFMILVYFIPVAMLMPQPIGIGALYVLFGGYLFSEINSILSHLNLSKDEGKTELFSEFLKTIFKGGKGE